MSDKPQGEGWWLASNGKWYPPESRQSPASPPGPGAGPPPGHPDEGAVGPPPGAPPRGARSGGFPWVGWPVAVVVLAVLVAAAAVGVLLGRSGDGGESGAGDSAAADLSGAVESLVDRWGDEGAFLVVMAAYDRGYTAAQVIDAAADGELQADGTVTGTDPARPPQDFLSDGPSDDGEESMGPAVGPMIFAGAGDDTETPAGGDTSGDAASPEDGYVETLDQWASEAFAAGQEAVDRLQQEEEAEAAWVRWVSELTVALGAQGYSGPQILEALVLDGLAPAPDLDFPCNIGIAAPGGGYLQPEFAPWEDLGCVAAGDEVSREGDDGSSGDGDTDGEGAPSGSFTGTWDDSDPSLFHPTADDVSLGPISVQITGDTWTVEASWSTTTSRVGGGCSFTASHVVTGGGPLTEDDGGYNLIVTSEDGTVTDHWTTDRAGDGCTDPRTDSGEEPVTVFIFDEDDGTLTGTVDSHPVTLTPG